MIKVHIFSGFENPKLGITKDTELEHLYSTRDSSELIQAALDLGLKEVYVQRDRDTDFVHFDLWGAPLRKAREIHKTVNDKEFYTDLGLLRLTSK
jgi:hypothetical protein